MGKVQVESSSKLAWLAQSIDEVKDDINYNLKLLNDAFAIANESWQDKNAQTCRNVLGEHNAAMRATIKQLGRWGNAIGRLSQLASDYENI